MRRAAWHAVLACVLLAGCSNFSILGVLDATAPATASTLKLSPATVNVQTGGTQRFTATGGTGGYSFSVLAGGAGGYVDPSGLYTAPGTAGTDSVIVTDSSGATSESVAQITASIPLSISPTSTTVNAGGNVTFSASGGAGGYTFSLASGAGSVVGATYTAPWAAGSATVQVTDAVLATRTAVVTVNAPTPVQISPSTVNLNAGGSVTFTATGGSGSYGWSTTGAGSLVGSTYHAPWAAETAVVRVTDSNTGSWEEAAVTVSGLSLLQITPSTVDINANGSVTFSASGGSGSYTWSKTGLGVLSGSTYTASGSAETAHVRLTDANTSLWIEATVNVTVPVALTVSPKPVTLEVGGTVTFSAGGGTPPYTYSLISGGGSLLGATYTAPWSATTARVRVTDSAASPATDDADITVNPPTPLAISPSSATLDAGQGVTFTATGGSGSYSWSKVSGGGTLVGVTYTAPWTATTAVVRVTDANTGQWKEATISVNPAPALTITPSTANVTAGDSVTFTPGGGSGSYSFSVVSGSGTLVGPTYTTATAETADIRLTDTNTLDTKDATVNVYLPLALIPSTATVQTNGTYPFTSSGGKPPYTYAVVSGGGSIDSAGVFLAPSAAGTSTVQVTDALSNQSTAVVTIEAIGAWTLTAIDASSRSGQYASLALDGGGLPKIAYYESAAKELRLAAYNGVSWSLSTVDTAGRVGQYASLALAPGSGYPRISYYDSTNKQLDYAAWNGSGWDSPQVVDTSGTVGLYTSLAMDPGGNPRISYYDQSNNRLKFASWNGSSWSIQNVNSSGSGGMYTSLALDPATGLARISYYDNSSHLRLASWDGSSWAEQTVDSSGDVGMYSSLALKPGTGHARISYYDRGGKDLKFASWDGSSWSVQVVDSPGDVGSYSSLALQPGSKYPAIGYYDATNRDLKYVDASWNGSSWVWNAPQAVDTGSGNNVGQYASLKFDSATGKPRIAFYDQAAQDLKFAKQ